MTETIEGAASPPVCPPHVWVIDRDKAGNERKQTPAETKAENQRNSDALASKPSKAEQKRGYDHEKKAIEKNEATMEMIATSVILRCDLCKIEQEIDILAKDQVAECKSRNTKQVKNKSKQRHNYQDIQRQINEHTGENKKPLAKTDGSLPDAADTEKLYGEKGFQVEMIK